MDQIPNPPSGIGPQANWLRRIWNALRRQKILPGRGYRVKYTSQGTVLEIDASQGAGGKSNQCPYA